jgi:antitoxin HicB
MLQFNALFEPDKEKGGFVVTFPDFGWGVTQGETEEEALAMASDALAIIVADYIKTAKELPRARLLKGRKYRAVSLPALEDMKAELYLAFRESGVTKSELARRLGIPKTTVDRLFDFKNRTRFDHLDAAFRALNKRLRVTVQGAA